jgi:GH35 family endo-1,4-beta-xylanase
MRPAFTKFLPAALAATAVLALPSAAGAAPGMEIAVQDDHALVTQSYSKANRNVTLDLARRFQTKWVRANVLWAASNGKQAKLKNKPANPTYDFTSYDQLILAARERDMEVELTISGSAPAWATGDKKIGPNKPNAKYFREFVKAVVAHYSGLVTRYSIWNEPNLSPWLAPLASAPKLYRSLYAAAYSEIKKANPNAQVLIGETSPYGTKGRSTPPIEFIRKMLAGGPLTADGYAHHPYDFQHAPNFKWPGSTNATLGTLSNLTKELDRQAKSGRLRTPGGAALDIYLTEYGYLRAGRHKLSEGKRAQYLKQAYDIALATPRVRQMLQYLLIEPTKKYQFFDMSLANSSGKTFGAAFNALVKWSTNNQSQINGSGR